MGTESASGRGRPSGSPALGSEELILDARGIHAWYGSSHVLHGVDIQIHRGQTVGLLGRNGMGKTTLIRTLMGLLPARRGQVLLDGQDAAQDVAVAVVGVEGFDPEHLSGLHRGRRCAPRG